MERLGLGWQMASSLNPRLIYCSLPGFASDDPRAQVRAFEGVIGAATATYRSPTDGDDRPIYTAIPIASNYAALQAAVSIVMALLARQRDGSGQRLEVPLFDSTFPSIGARALRVHDPAHIVPTPRGIWNGVFGCADVRGVQLGASDNQTSRIFVKAAVIPSGNKRGLTKIH